MSAEKVSNHPRRFGLGERYNQALESLGRRFLELYGWKMLEYGTGDTKPETETPTAPPQRVSPPSQSTS